MNLKSTLSKLAFSSMAMMMLVTGCGSEEPETEKEKTSEETTAKTGNIESFDLVIDGKKYELPVDTKDFEDNGWDVNGTSVTKGDQSLDVEEKKVTVHNSVEDKKITDDLSFDSTMDDVVKSLGKPSNADTYENTGVLIYHAQDKKISFVFSGEAMDHYSIAIED